MSRLSRSLLNNLFYPLLLLFRLLARALPERLCYMLGSGLGHLAYLVLPERRRTAVMNISQALNLPAGEAALLARASFISFGLVGVEFLRFSGRREQLARLVSFRGLQHLREAMARGTGVILCNAHIGNLEIAGQALAMVIDRPLHPIVHVQTGGLFNTMLDRERRAVGAVPIERGFALREMLRALKKGELVQIMPDQYTFEKGALDIPFFGRFAATPRGLAVVARHSRAPVVPVFSHRTRPGYHEVVIFPPLPMTRTDDEEADNITNMTRVNALLEEVIRAHPEQWLWMHKRWKVKPKKDKQE